VAQDAATFASVSLDGTLKMWSVTGRTPNFSLEVHAQGVNSVDFCADKPLVLTGADDHSAKIFDYQTKACVHTLEGHTQNVTAVAFHPEMPLLITGSEDGTVRLWNANTYGKK
jgi:coatomer subunit beta'